jgi:hypothetical protein
MEHRSGPVVARPLIIIATSGLHAAPVPATEHRSSTDQSTQDSSTILTDANTQVRDLLRVRRQGLEPRTRGLRACAGYHGGHLAPMEHRGGLRCSIDGRGGGAVESWKQRTSGPLVATSGYRESASWRLRMVLQPSTCRSSGDLGVKIAAHGSLQRCRLGRQA